MAARMTRSSPSPTPVPIRTGGWKNRQQFGKRLPPPLQTSQRQRDGGCRTMAAVNGRSEAQSTACFTGETYGRAIDELFGQGGQEAPPVPSASAAGVASAAPAMLHSTPDVRNCGLPAHAAATSADRRGNMPSTWAERRRPGWASHLRKAVALCSVALGAILFLGSTPRSWRADVTAPPLRSNTLAPATDVAPRDGGFLLRPIEEVQVGDRVAGTNPLREQVEQVEPDPASWRKLSFRMRKADGLLLWVDLLRPLAWVKANEIELGRTVFLNLPEMGAVGNADVTYVGPCPPIKCGSGTVVTGKFVHESDGSSVVHLRLTGQTEPTGVTRNHPYWSLDRKEFVKVGGLRIGETVDTELGPRRVLCVEASNYSGLLYNLETTEHVYRVATEGALVHNACGVYRYRDSVTRAYYIGSSNNIARRLVQHGAKVIPGTATTLKNMAQASSRVQLHVQEQIAILRAGGIKNLSNKINAVGMARAHRIPSAVRRRYNYYP